MKYLLKMGSNVNLRVVEGEWFTTALQRAAAHGNIRAVFILLGNGADVNAKGPSKGLYHCGTAIVAAIYEGNIEIARILLENGADMNAQESVMFDGVIRHRNALRIAAFAGRLDAVQLLLNAGAYSYEDAIEEAISRNLFVIADLIKDWMEKHQEE